MDRLSLPVWELTEESLAIAPAHTLARLRKHVLDLVACGEITMVEAPPATALRPRVSVDQEQRISDDAAGLGELTGMFAAHGGGPGTVKIAIETERGLLVASLRAAGYEIYPVNLKAVDRYRGRHHLARASPMPPMRWCWRISCAPTRTCTGRCPLTAPARGRSRCWPAPTRT
jgi:hypothetical protein